MDLLEKIFNAGVVGGGGAGFPTHIKLNAKVEYLIINGAECEPLIETDKYLMRTYSDEIVKAMAEAGKIVDAEKIVIGLKGKYKDEIKALENSIQNLNSNIEIFKLDNFYPAGDEQVLVYEVTKRSIPAGGIPLDVGVVVSNVGTMANIYDSISDKAVIDKYVSVVGEVDKPCIIKVPIGISVEKCIEEVGGTKIDDYCIIMGGPMMGRIVHKDKINNEVVTKTVGSIIVIPKDHYIVRKKEKSIKHIINTAKSACTQCSMCTDLCPRYLIGHNIRPHRIMRSVGLNQADEKGLMEALICCECGVCELYACPMGLSPRSVNVYMKNALREKGIRYKKEEVAFSKEMREYRKVPTDRLLSRLDLNKYKVKDISGSFEIKTNKVSIPLNQHIGKPANSVVSIGDVVSKGQLIGKVEFGEFGANIHASIDGIVCEVSNNIVIESEINEVIV